jgi:uncharacterized membrane protein YfcA
LLQQPLGLLRIEIKKEVMTFPQGLILFCAAILGGTLNSVAGGGSFICFPALVFTGLPAIPANATNSVALWPGSVASVGAYRRELARQERVLLILMVSTSLIGGILGALLLLKTPPEIFVRLVPYLLLVATLLFTFSGPITARLRRQKPVGVRTGAVGTGLAPVRIPTAPDSAPTLEKVSLSVPLFVGLAFAQLLIAVYGGYFGGGIGILMLAALAVMGMSDIHVMNALKTLLASCINGVAVITFIVAGVVAWPQAILMIIGAVIGGYGGAYYARKIPQKWVRLFVIGVGFSMTIYFLFLHK